jgi:two-component system cell cycle sensor histidine kinase/response regulator CckA
MDIVSTIEPTLGNLEEEYRLTFLKDDMRLSSIGILLAILFTIPFAYNDYLFFGNAGQFWLLALGRTTLASYGIVLLFVFRKLERVAIYERLVLTFLIFTTLFIFYVNTTRPSPYQMNVTLDVLIVFALYFLFPNRLLFRLLSAFLMSFCTLLTSISYRSFYLSPAMVTIFLSLALANAAGIVISARWDRLRRSWFKALAQNKLAEEALRKSEALYRELFENSSDIVYTHDLEGKYTSVNGAMRRILGYSSKEFLTLTYRDIVDSEHIPLTEENLRIKVESGVDKTGPYELRVRSKAGAPLWVEINSRIIRDGGKAIGVHGTARDITGRKKAEEALKESEEKYRIFVHKAHEGIHVAQDGRLKFLNPAAAEIWGHSEEELLSRPFIEFIHPDDQEVVLDRSLRRARGEEVPSRYTHRIVTADGKIRWVEINPAAISWQGKPAILVFSFDVTERERMRDSLKQAEETLELALKGADLGLWDYNFKTGKAFINERRAEMLGYSVDELGPYISSWGKLLHPDDIDRVIDAFNAHVKGRTPLYECEQRLRHKSGRYIWVLDRAKVVEWDEQSNPVRAVGTSLDITDRKRTEEALLSARNDLERLVEERTEDLRTINEELKGQIRERLLAEEALKESESKFRSIVENSVAGMFTVDEVYHFIYVNDELCEILGRSRERLVGLDFREVLAEDSRELVADRYVRRSRGEKVPSRYEIEVVRGDGEIRQVEMLVAVVWDASGLPRTMGQLIDVTDRKQAEESLLIEKERFQILSDRAPLGMAKIAADGTYEYVNPKFTEIFGYELSDIPNRREWLRKAYPDSSNRHKVAAAWNEDLEGIAPGGSASRVFEVTCKDGGQKTIQFVGVKLRAGEHLMTCEDITGRMRAEQALRDSEEKYRALFENSIDAVYMTTRNGILIDANQAFLDLFGLSREEARNMKILRIYNDAADRKRFQEEIERKGSVTDYEISFRKKDGAIIDCLLTSTVRRDKNDAILGYHGIIRDVTERKQLQRQLIQAQKMEAVGTLAGGIAHDFNNLLQAILGYTDILLMRKKPDDPDRQKLEIVRQAAWDGADLVSRILTFSMKAEFTARPTDLNQEIRIVEKLLLRTVPKMIKIDLVLAEDVWIINADPAQIEQVLLNLTVNAQHAMPDGGRLLIETSNVSLEDDYVRTHLKAKLGKYVLLTVSDSGVGMKPDIVDRIFEPFFTTKANGQGTGLGLAMVHGIVSQHGGYIRCYSEPGLGTSFKIYFPASSAQSLLDLAITREMPAFGTETILLVDDDDRIRDLALQMIEMGGYKALAASSGEEALKMYAAHTGEVDLVILDLIMPGMGGKRCLEELLRIDPDSKVLIASGYSSNGLTIDETGSGARGFVRKPYDAKDILISIRKVLDQDCL